MQLSRIIALPFFVLAVYILYNLYYHNTIEWSLYILFPAIALVAIYIFHNQINALGWKWWPPKIDPVLFQMVHTTVPFVKSLSAEDQKSLFQILHFDIRRNDFTGMKVEDIPEDIKAMCVLPGSLMTQITNTPINKEYNQVVLYKHPFPSQQYNDWHTSEIHHEDGVFLFSLEHLVPGYAQKSRYPNIAFYEWAQALRFHHPTFKSWEVNEEVWESLEAIPPLSKSVVTAYVGLEGIDVRDVLITGYFTHQSELREVVPEVMSRLDEMFLVGP